MPLRPEPSNPSFGKRCESLAAGYLFAKGITLVKRNLRTRLGEIDLLCEDGETLVFVEVKARHGEAFGRGCEAVGWHKQRRLMAIASLYLAPLPPRACRFDVVSIAVTRGRPVITHLPNAFP